MLIARLAVLTLVAALWASPATAVEVQKIIAETQRASQEGNEMTLVMWLPNGYWEAALDGAGKADPKRRKQFLDALKPYLLLAVVKGTIGLGGTLEARSKAELLSNSKLVIDGRALEPVAPEAVSPAAQSILGMLKPMLVGMMGSMGQGIELLVYPAMQGDHLLIDEHERGGFTYTLYEHTYTWRLPLASFLPVRVDAKTGEEFPGTYDFNPYTGDRLPRPESAAAGSRRAAPVESAAPGRRAPLGRVPGRPPDQPMPDPFSAAASVPSR